MTPPDSAHVAIVGAGPVGLALALGLGRYGVRSVLFEREAATSAQSKAPAIHQRSREILRQWGVEDSLVHAGTLLETMTVHSVTTGRTLHIPFDFSCLDSEAHRPGLLILEQGQTERLLLKAVRDTGLCDVRFGAEVTGVSQDADAVTLTFREDGAQHRLTTQFAVGCDGAGSFVRNALDLPFPGVTLPVRPMLADVRIDDERDALPWPRNRNSAEGITSAMRLAPGLWRIIGIEPGGADVDEAVTDDEVRARAAEVLGSGPAKVTWANRFQLQRRGSPRYRVGRVLLAGDAAHVFPPAMGQGMNAGIQDAHNLAWKLARAVCGGDTDRLLDSYDDERRGVIGEVSRYVTRVTRVGIQAPAFIRSAVLHSIRWALAIPPLRRKSLRSLAMLDRDYGASPLLASGERAAGVRLPNVELGGVSGEATRIYDVLPDGPALLDIGTGDRVADDLPAVLRIGASGYHDASQALRDVLGADSGWILVRPDRHVAWARTGSAADLKTACSYALGGRL
ncbi:FAD-dependent monooxygenase [Mycobacterium sp. SMC-4]|uniref:FAD-dependent monooxygenase n=1 Tax=Mycobacterium sp. SMC-4 TaxID=2857059 RepID=UPI0021B2B635|nr:FAD-dependent monooxygenase [Mycobacterium sp. SMC-4]UXA17167.1 FAD-dependent monooxygenase [Mycobacterium sp. SMC-4]